MSIKKVGVFLCVPALAALTLGALALDSVRPGPGNALTAEPPNKPDRPQTDFLPVMLRAGGFVPREISRPAGEYVISVNDQSGAQGLTLRFDRENGGRLHEAKVSRRKPHWRQLLRLTPGTYLITEADHPDWVCRITVTAN
jgi:hypothetical protein